MLLQIVFDRKESGDCSNRVIFRDLGTTGGLHRRGSKSLAAKQLPCLLGDLQIFSRSDHEGPQSRADSSDVAVLADGEVELGVQSGA